MEGDVAVRKVPLREPIREDTFLFPIGINVFYRVIRKANLFGAIRVVLLALLTMLIVVIKCKLVRIAYLLRKFNDF